MKKVIIITDGLQSTQDYTTDPDLVQVSIPLDFLLDAKKDLAYMAQRSIASVTYINSVGAKFFTSVEMLELDELEGKQKFTDSHGNDFAEDEPDYKLELGAYSLASDGEVSVIWKFKGDSSDELFITIGVIDELLGMIDPQSAQDQNIVLLSYDPERNPFFTR